MSTITGYITALPNDARDISDEDEEETQELQEDDDDNWLDYSQMKTFFSDGVFVKNKKPLISRIELQDCRGVRHNCRGRFLLTDPWWDITVTINKQKNVHGPVLYALRRDEEGIQHHKLVNLLLTKVSRSANIQDPGRIVGLFETFIRDTKQEDKLSFEHLFSLLQEFKKWLLYSGQDLNLKDIHYILKSVEMQLVLRAQRYPKLLRFLCQLFPFRFPGFLVTLGDDVLPQVEAAVTEQPWIFGFNKILTLRYHLFGMEASLKAFQSSKLLNNIPCTQKDALYIYEVLKQDAACRGHTYITLSDLRQHRQWNTLNFSVTNWLPALTFLSNNMITREERFNSKRNIFLYHNWKAEIDIADGLEKILHKGIQCGSSWNVDFSSPDLAILRQDPEQWGATQKLASSPICVLSGKGGCGKTTVVTKLIKHICLRNPVQETVSFLELDSDPLSTFDEEEMSEISRIMANEPKFLEQVPALQLQQTCPMAVFKSELNSRNETLTPQKDDTENMPDLSSQLEDFISENQQKRLQPQCPKSTFQDARKLAKKHQMSASMCMDLAKYLISSADISLSNTVQGEKILLTAPTGKAAKLLGHKAQMEACTLHHIIYSYRAFVKSQVMKHRENKKSKEGPKQNGEETGKALKLEAVDATSVVFPNEDNGVWKYAHKEILVVDECSLVSLRTFATLLNILLEHAKLSKLILLGDVRQLPSIEPGNFLADIFAVFEERGFSMELKTNHRSESDLIVNNATRISHQNLPMFDPSRHFHFCKVEDADAEPERDSEIRKLLQSLPELASHESSQFITFRRSDCEAINEICCQHYNYHSTCLPYKSGKLRMRLDFQVGDKVCFRKNGQVTNYGTRLQHYLPDKLLSTLGFNVKPQVEANSYATTLKMDASAAANIVFNEGKSFNTTHNNSFHSRAIEPCSHINNPNCTEPIMNFGLVMQNCPSTKFLDTAKDCVNFSDVHTEMNKNRTFNKSVCLKGPNLDMSTFETSVIQDDSPLNRTASKLKDRPIRLCNGEIFYIMAETTTIEKNNKNHCYLTLSDRDPECPRVFCCLLSELKRECHIQHAWSRTLHTYQGSESDIVVYYLGDSKAQTWKHIYTAVTRGRKAVFIVGKKHHLQESVWKYDMPRRSRLQRVLCDMLKRVNIPKWQAMVRACNEQAKTDVQTASVQFQNPTADIKEPTLLLESSVSSSRPKTVESFLDSDDSWVQSISETWVSPSAGTNTDTYQKIDDGYTSTSEELLSPSINKVQSQTVNVKGQMEASCEAKDGENSVGILITPGKRHTPLKQEHVTPTKRLKDVNQEQLVPTERRRDMDPLDCIVSPIRRNLNI